MPRIGICGVVELKKLILQIIERGQDKWSNYILWASYFGQGGRNIPVSTVQDQIVSLRKCVNLMKHILTPDGNWARS
jgi:hypothetical protein